MNIMLTDGNDDYAKPMAVMAREAAAWAADGAKMCREFESQWRRQAVALSAVWTVALGAFIRLAFVYEAGPLGLWFSAMLPVAYAALAAFAYGRMRTSQVEAHGYEVIAAYATERADYHERVERVDEAMLGGIKATTVATRQTVH